MPLSLRGVVLACKPFLILEIEASNALKTQSSNSFTYTGHMGDMVKVKAYAPILTKIEWTVEAVNGDQVVPPPAPLAAGPDPSDASVLNISLSNPHNVLPKGMEIRVTAKAGNLTKSIKLVIRPASVAIALTDNHYAFSDASGNYAINLSGLVDNAADRTVQFKAITSPVGAAAASHVVFEAVDGASQPVLLSNISPGLAGLPLNKDQAVTVKAKIADTDTESSALKIAVRAKPDKRAGLPNGLGVKLAQFDFAGSGRFDVIQENKDEFVKPFPARWDTTHTQYPQAYSAGSEIKLESIKLEVTDKPGNAKTDLLLRGTLYFIDKDDQPQPITTIQAAASVPANTVVGSPVAVADMSMASGGTVPDKAGLSTPLLIFWEVSADAGTSWASLAVTGNDLYVTAAKPAKSTRAQLNDGTGNQALAFDSILFMSCSHIRGLSDAGAVRDKIVEFFKNPNPNNKIKRLRRDKNGVKAAPESLTLGYWLPGLSNPAMWLNPPSDANRSYFLNTNGNLQCSTWTDMLLSMWAIHGLGDGILVYVAPSIPGRVNSSRQLTNSVAGSNFMVVNWEYNQKAQLDQNNYTHTQVGREVAPGLLVDAPPPRCVSLDTGAPGQNCANPLDSFQCHFIVKQGSQDRYFDPSYGTGPFTAADWIKASIAGLIDKSNNKAGFVKNTPAGPVPHPKIVTFKDFDKNTYIT